MHIRKNLVKRARSKSTKGQQISYNTLGISHTPHPTNILKLARNGKPVNPAHTVPAAPEFPPKQTPLILRDITTIINK